MNTTRNGTRLTGIRLRPTQEAISSWQVQPAAVSYTFERAFGDPSDEFPGEDFGVELTRFKSPEIEPEEFEAVYLWFYS